MNNRSAAKFKHLQRDAGLFFAGQRELKGLLLNSKNSSLYFCAHTSNSMNPTLCESDILEIAAYDDRPIRRGDVILFLSPDGNRPAIHRVVSVTPRGIRTKGDNNTRKDPWLIHREDVIGQVVRAAQGKKQRSIRGGTAGRLWSFGVGRFRVAVRGLSFLSPAGTIRAYQTPCAASQADAHSLPASKG